MPQRPPALGRPALARALNDAGAEHSERSSSPSWEVEMAELMGRMSPDQREALLRIARAMAEAAAA